MRLSDEAVKSQCRYKAISAHLRKYCIGWCAISYRLEVVYVLISFLLLYYAEQHPKALAK